jgi:hypothetical protein
MSSQNKDAIEVDNVLPVFGDQKYSQTSRRRAGGRVRQCVAAGKTSCLCGSSVAVDRAFVVPL